MKLRFAVSHPFRKEREMGGAPRFCGYMSEKQTRVLRLASLAQDDSVFESDGDLLGLIAWGVTGTNEWQT
jgi:hypothetical protein